MPGSERQVLLAVLCDLDLVGRDITVPLVCQAFPVGCRSSDRVVSVKRWMTT
ncbi:hypothetical protein I546_3914 [Mycobacterium kansasii 732]|nr:hypothetical protein I546_3914 [Mycobacterium kansasii 732]